MLDAVVEDGKQKCLTHTQCFIFGAIFTSGKK